MFIKKFKLQYITLLAAPFMVTVFLLLPSKVSALSGSQFDAGNIISDSVFFNGSSMSVYDIQNFLNAKVPNCDTWGTQPYNGTTRAAYASSRGVSTPFTCLKNYSQSVPSVAGNEYCGGGMSGGNKSSAGIIYDVAQACNISPKVLLVLLQKEQSLVTDDWPWPVQYRSATGYGCPDTAPCDAEYYGFFNQVYQAAKAYNRYRVNAANYNYRAGRNNTILWNPNAGCGSSTVYIKNQATAGLYIYTPYRPNQAALDNLYGTGDGCSSYGNRNFWRMFNDWFGNTQGIPFAWEVIANNFYDINKNSSIDPAKVKAGEKIRVSLKVKNTGSEIWYKNGPNPVTLATVRPNNRLSSICDPSWLSCNRVALPLEEVIPPGEEGHFEFMFTVPHNNGEYREYFAPVLENRSWMDNDTGYHVYFRSNNTYSWEWGSYGVWSDPARTQPIDVTKLFKGQYFYVTLYAINTSATTWNRSTSNPVSLGSYSPYDRHSILCAYQWLPKCNRAAVMNEPQVFPGQTASFSFLARAPYEIGEYREFFKPVAEYDSWMQDDMNHIYLRVTH